MGSCCRLLLFAFAVLASATSVAAQSLPRTVLVLDQSDADSVWFEAFSSAFRAALNAKSATQVSVYSEHIDLNRFSGARHDDVVRTFLRDKFGERPIGVIVAQGSGALDFLTRAHLWPNAPVVMAAVDDATVARLRLPPNVIGTTYRLTFRDAVASAKTLVPDLKQIALVGDPFERQAVRSHFKAEIPVVTAGLELIDLLGLPMAELLKRVAVLPEDTAIIYTAINTDGAGVVYHPHEALRAVSQAANRPIVIDAETSVGFGGTALLAPVWSARIQLTWYCAFSTGKSLLTSQSPRAVSPGRFSTGASSSALVSMSANCRKTARYAFARRPSGINIAGRQSRLQPFWLPRL